MVRCPDMRCFRSSEQAVAVLDVSRDCIQRVNPRFTAIINTCDSDRNIIVLKLFSLLLHYEHCIISNQFKIISNFWGCHIKPKKRLPSKIRNFLCHYFYVIIFALQDVSMLQVNFGIFHAGRQDIELKRSAFDICSHSIILNP